MPRHINGSITAWDNSSNSGSMKAAADGKEWKFTKEDISANKFSAPYQPKVGDQVTGNPKEGSEGALTAVMEFI